jgi:hypothetical protein
MLRRLLSGWKWQFRWHIPFLFWKWNFVNLHYTSRSFKFWRYTTNTRGTEHFDTPGRGFARRSRRRR